MSLAAIDRVRRRHDIKPHLRRFLQAVAFYVLDDGAPVAIYVDRLADDLGVTRRRVQQIQVEAREAGFISYTPTGHQGQNVYALLPERGEAGFAENAASTKPASPNAKPISPQVKPASPLLDSDSDSDSLPDRSLNNLGGNQSESERGEAGFTPPQERETGFAETYSPLAFDEDTLPPSALPFAAWLSDVGINNPACDDLARRAVDQGVSLDDVKLARLLAWRLEAHNRIENWPGWLIQVVRNDGWRGVITAANALLPPAANSPPANKPRRQSRAARMYAELS